MNLNKLDWGLIDSKNWAFNDDERHKKMAEALIFNRVGIEETDAIVVYNNRVADGVRKIFEKNGITPPPILLDNGLAYGRYRFFYTKYFLQGRDHETLIMGPYFLKHGYKQLLEQINQNRQANNQV